jgi:hypothetical protein
MHTCSQWNFKSRLRSMAPGSRPASHRDLKAVADAEQRPAAARKLGTALMIGEKRAIAPVRR